MARVLAVQEEAEVLSADPAAAGRSPAPRWRPLKSQGLSGHARSNSDAIHIPADASSLSFASSEADKGHGGGTRAAWRRRAAAMMVNEQFLGVLSMLLLVFQGTALSLTLRYSRANVNDPYLPSAAVILTEVAKLAVCVVAQLATCSREAKAKSETWRSEFTRQYRDITHKSVPLIVPAALFVLQQVLVIVAATHLDAIMFQIFSQSFKIIPTALFAVWLLGQQLTGMQWGSLPVLVIGVVLVTMNKSEGRAVENGNWLLGMLASSLSGLSSAYAGVYFEKYVKGKNSASLWVRNMQLSLYGVPLSAGYALLKDGAAIRARGLFQGFDALTWGVIFLQVFGGLIVGMVVKYADNILKNFANAISVILTVVFAIPLFGLWPNFNFLLGVAVVLFSVFLYGNSVWLGESKTLAYIVEGCNRRRKAFLRRTGLLNENGDSCISVSFILLVATLVAALIVLAAFLTVPARGLRVKGRAAEARRLLPTGL